MESSESTPPSISPPQHTYQLQVPAGLPEEITAYYKLHQPPCGSLQYARVHLDPMLLSPSSKAINPDDPHSILICNDCHRSLSTICLIFLLFKLNHAILTHVLLGSTSSKNPDAPPRFAIAHGLFAGIFPHQLRAATTVEIRLMSPVVCIWKGYLYTAFDDAKHSALQANCCVFNSNPSLIASSVPRASLDNDSEVYNVILGGKLNAEHKDTIKRCHQVRARFLTDLGDFWFKLNFLFLLIKRDDESIAALDGSQAHFTNLIDVCCAPDAFASSTSDEPPPADAAHDNMTPEHILNSLRSESSAPNESMHESPVGAAAVTVHFMSSILYPETQAQLNPASTVQLLMGGTYQITGHGDLVSYTTPFITELMFPAHFPYGRGGPSEPRASPQLRCHEVLRHYANASDRYFQKNHELMLYTYQQARASSCVLKAYFSTHGKANEHNNVASLQVTPEQLEAVLIHKEQVTAARKTFQPAPPRPEGLGSAEILANRVHCSLGNMHGSDEYQQKGLQRLWATVYQNGLPDAFLTLSPNFNGSIQVKFMAEGFPDYTHSWKVPLSCVPTDAEHKMLASENPGIAAVWFETVVTTYIEVVLGFDEKAQLPKRGRKTILESDLIF